MYGGTYNEAYDRTSKIIWNNETIYNDNIAKHSSETNHDFVLFFTSEEYDAPSTDGTYSASIEVTNPDGTNYGSNSWLITLSSALSNDKTFNIQVSATNKLTIYFETGRSLTENKTATITATYSNKNQDYSTYSSFKKQDTLDLASGSY